MKNTQLLKSIEDFIAETGMSESYFGSLAGSGTELVKRLRAGGDVQTGTEQKIKTFMRFYRAHGTAPPEHRERIRERARKARARRMNREAES